MSFELAVTLVVGGPILLVHVALPLAWRWRYRHELRRPPRPPILPQAAGHLVRLDDYARRRGRRT